MLEVFVGISTNAGLESVEQSKRAGRVRSSSLRIAICGLIFVASAHANAVTTYAAAFNGPAGVNGAEQFGTDYASASYFFDNGVQSMYAQASAEPGRLRAFANASNTTGARQFATAVAKAEDSFYLAQSSGINVATITWVLDLEGVCFGTPGSTGGVPNAACGVQVSLNGGSPWGIQLDHPGEITRTADVEIVNGFGFNNIFPVAPILQVDGYATNGVFAGDFSDTARIYAYTTTPGVTLVSQSGYDYAFPVQAPVPEPETALLLLVGAVGLVMRGTNPATKRGARRTR